MMEAGVELSLLSTEIESFSFDISNFSPTIINKIDRNLQPGIF